MQSIKLFSRLTLISLALLGLSLSSASAATLNIDGGGNLLGASGVDVGGTIYDVEFLDGSCVDNFNGCDAVSDFDFTTEADALLASAALMVIILDTVDGDFDSVPTLTNGCSFDSWCYIVTPYELVGVNMEGAFFLNFSSANGGTDESGSPLRVEISNGNSSNVVYADWSVSQVPVPAALWLFGTALIGLVGFGKRRKVS